MRTLEVRPEEILILSEFRYSELKKIQIAMDHCTVAMDLTKPEMKAAHDFFVESFYKWVDTTVKGLEDGS